MHCMTMHSSWAMVVWRCIEGGELSVTSLTLVAKRSYFNCFRDAQLALTLVNAIW